VGPAVAAVKQAPVEVHLALMHGFTLQLLLSGVTFCCGVALFFGRKKLADSLPPGFLHFPFTPSSLYSLALQGIQSLAGLSTRWLQNGHLHLYILTIVLTAVFGVGVFLFNVQGELLPFNPKEILIHEGVLALTLITATLLAAMARSRLVAIIALGVLGYGVVLFYVVFGAPDVAMTQFAVDTLTLILLVLVMKRLPRYGRFSTPRERFRDGLAALTFGGIITGCILLAQGVVRESKLATYFNENSFVLAKGRNIVNVILVDFRALDTLGEVTVLVVAGIGVFSLLKLKVKQNDAFKEL
jgi:multicomponent Na+:H+ antiporter subunit A